ncbi:MAG: SNF2-related protein [bacterium]
MNNLGRDMRVPITKKLLIDWGGPRVFRDAEMLVDNGRVLEAVYDPPRIHGSLFWNNRPFKTSLRILPDGQIESRCPCSDNTDRGLVCAHVIAMGIVLMRRATDPQRDAKYEAEQRHAARVASVDEDAYIRRVPRGTPGALPAELRVTVPADWQECWCKGKVPVTSEVEYGGKIRLLDEVPRDAPLCFSQEDESLLFVLEDISQGPGTGRLDLNRYDFINLVRLRTGKGLLRTGGSAIVINEPKMTTRLRMDLDRENGEIIVSAHTELPFMREGQRPFYLVLDKAGWVYGADNLWPLENVLPAPYHPIYQDVVIVARQDVVRFLGKELPILQKYARIESDISPDLFTIEPADPKFHLLLRGSPASLSATLYAGYGAIEVVAGHSAAAEDFAMPDPGDLMRYGIRNKFKENEGLEMLRSMGFAERSERGSGIAAGEGEGLMCIVGERQVLNFMGAHLPALRRRGWRVKVEGRAAPYMDEMVFAAPVVKIQEASEGGWFDVGFDFEDGQGLSLSPNEIQRALRKGDSFIESGGRRILIDSDAVQSMLDIFSDCASGESDRAGHFRMAGIHAAFVKSSLDALDGVDVEVSPEWRTTASRSNRTVKIEPVILGEPLDGILRSYQKDGVNWLRFLEKSGFCGLLADEMGLGKTVQTLAWLQLDRLDESARRKPALIVCPTSIVENWVEEAQRFVPRLKVMSLTGPDRHSRFEQVPGMDLVVTSYAVLRRDVEHYAKHEFSAAILDEAQHIKNPSTQNAAAAARLKARSRLVLTGTPVENSVSDLWSIMDFLMPGYLGNHGTFKERYEQPISRGGPDAEVAQVKLRRKVHPFMLRRLKADVAKDLPPKIERIATCELTADQKAVYSELLRASRQKIEGMMSKQGFNKARMEILTVLMRLRQVCCHLGLLELPGLKAQYPSAKMELFFELLDEALDSGHRLLVFSQFVKMLHILRDELTSRKVAHCYLDGSTKDRMQVVHTFNTERSIPVFLISLKAGGTGLNLTGADMVIHFDPWWNPAVEDQATDRAYRIGQKRTVYGIKLISKGTVEEKVLALQQKKKAIIGATIESDERMVESLNWQDIQDLLSL